MIQEYSKTYYYILYFTLYFIGETLSIWGQYVTLPFKTLSYWDSLKMVLPFAWVNWIFRTFAIDIGHTQNLVNPTQTIFLIIITQFTLILIVNYFYLKQNVYRSDIIGFFILLFGYIISFFDLVSKTFNIPIPKDDEGEKDSKKERDRKKREEKKKIKERKENFALINSRCINNNDLTGNCKLQIKLNQINEINQRNEIKEIKRENEYENERE